MRVLGIDPGYAICGYGVVEETAGVLSPVTFGAVTTRAHDLFEDRLLEIHTDLVQIFAQVKPQAMAVETLFFSTNAKTAVAVAQARGVVLLAARQAGVPVFEYSPLQVKQAVTGYGKATKKQIQEMVKLMLRLSATPKPDDAADALAIALCHVNSARSGLFGRTRTRRQEMGYE